MKRTSVQLTIVFALLLALFQVSSPATARSLSGSQTISTSNLEIPLPLPDGDDNPVLTDLSGDPDDLLGGNLAVSEPLPTRKPQVEGSVPLWKTFLRWVCSSLGRFSLTR